MKRIVKESYEVSPELENRLNSILADEWLAWEAYKFAKIAMVGKKQHLLQEVAASNGFDELEDHFKTLAEWMQAKGMKVVTSHSEMESITNCTPIEVVDGMSTTDLIDKLILSEEEAIAVYEDTIPHAEYDLRQILCDFLKDEREHLKELTDCRDEMGGGDKAEEAKKPNIFEGKVMKESDIADEEDTVEVLVTNIKWETDGARIRLPRRMHVPVPADIYDAGAFEVEEYVSDYISDETGFLHNGFVLPEFD